MTSTHDRIVPIVNKYPGLVSSFKFKAIISSANQVRWFTTKQGTNFWFKFIMPKRRNHTEVFCKKTPTLIKKILCHRCIAVNLANILRAVFLQNRLSLTKLKLSFSHFSPVYKKFTLLTVNPLLCNVGKMVRHTRNLAANVARF